MQKMADILKTEQFSLGLNIETLEILVLCNKGEVSVLKLNFLSEKIKYKHAFRGGGVGVLVRNNKK